MLSLRDARQLRPKHSHIRKIKPAPHLYVSMMMARNIHSSRLVTVNMKDVKNQRPEASSTDRMASKS